MPFLPLQLMGLRMPTVQLFFVSCAREVSSEFLVF